MASCFPDLSYLTNSSQGAGADVPQLSHMQPCICVLIAYRLSTQRASPQISHLIFWPWNKRVLMFLKNPAVIRTCDNKKQPHLKKKKLKIYLQHAIFPWARCLILHDEGYILYSLVNWSGDVEGKLAFDMKACLLGMNTAPWAQGYKYVFPSIQALMWGR